MELTDAIEAAVRVIDEALASEMQTGSGAPAAPHLDRLRQDLVAMRARNAIDADELRTMIRAVATWAPAHDVSLLSALGVIARARG